MHISIYTLHNFIVFAHNINKWTAYSADHVVSKRLRMYLFVSPYMMSKLCLNAFHETPISKTISTCMFQIFLDNSIERERESDDDWEIAITDTINQNTSQIWTREHMKWRAITYRHTNRFVFLGVMAPGSLAWICVAAVSGYNLETWRCK